MLVRPVWVGLAALIILVAAGLLARGRGDRAPDVIYAKHGEMPGDVARPRAIAIDPDGRVYLVDFTARIQAYDLDGNYLGITWKTPDFRNGRPSGLGIDRDGNVLVCDSHYHLVRTYTHDGRQIKQFGSEEMFGYVSDCVQDADGFYYVSEFGRTDRITKLDEGGRVLKTWGESGTAPGQFQRVRALALGPDGLLYAADSCNHRIQVFTKEGEFVRAFGEPGDGKGQFRYPFDLAFSPAGDLYVVERGNRRVQKLSPTGEWKAFWGQSGSKPGQLADPWAVAVDKLGRVHVVDTENHRVQRVRF
jgi:DNA-binding beta-propeller fold protein YncE